MIRVVVAALLLIAPLSASAMTCGEMLPGCEVAVDLRDANSTTEYDAAYCFGAARALTEVLIRNCALIHASGTDLPIEAAGVPPNVRAVVRAFVEWARARPQGLNNEFAASLMEAIEAAFPCQRL
jgi:hypothetical protein